MKKIFTTFLLTLMLTFSLSSISFAEKWIDMAGNSAIFYDEDSVTGLTESVYFVHTKFTCSPQKGREISNKFNFKEPVAYFIDRVEINHKRKIMATRTTKIFSNTGKILESYTNLDLEYEKIVPGEFSGILFDATFPIIKNRYNL